MVMTERSLDFAQSGGALGARLPVPKHHKPLPADAAESFSVSVRGLAEYLRKGTSQKTEAESKPREPRPVSDDRPGFGERTFLV